MCLTYLITFHTYGSWLHGADRGSVDRQHNRYATPFLPADVDRLRIARKRQKQDSVNLNAKHRGVVKRAIVEVCEFRQWELRALNVRTNHVHAVVTASAPAEKVLNDFKSYATRRLREAGLCDAKSKIWSRHGSTPHLSTEEAVESACRYVIDGQGAALPEE
jgi:REP element-mobilizing transposase RayT